MCLRSRYVELGGLVAFVFVIEHVSTATSIRTSPLAQEEQPSLEDGAVSNPISSSNATECEPAVQSDHLQSKAEAAAPEAITTATSNHTSPLVQEKRLGLDDDAVSHSLSSSNATESDTAVQPEQLQGKIEAAAPNLLLYSAGGVAAVGLAGVAIKVCCRS